MRPTTIILLRLGTWYSGRLIDNHYSKLSREPSFRRTNAFSLLFLRRALLTICFVTNENIEKYWKYSMSKMLDV